MLSFLQLALKTQTLEVWDQSCRRVVRSFARAIVKLKAVNLNHPHLTKGQLNVIFQTIVGECNLALQELRLAGVRLERVDKDLVDRVRKVVQLVN